MRTISDEERRALKGATDAAFRLGGGVTSFEHLTRCGVSTLSKYASINRENENTFIGVDVAIEADRWARSPVIVSAMARTLGFRLVPDGNEPAEITPLTERDAHNLLSEAMDVARETLIAFEGDGYADALERRRIRTELMELIRAAELYALKVRD